MSTPTENFYESLLRSFETGIEGNYDNTKNEPWDVPVPVTLEVDSQGDGAKSISGYFVSDDVWLAMCEELDARKELADAFLSGDYHRIARAVIWVERVTQEDYVNNAREDGS